MGVYIYSVRTKNVTATVEGGAQTVFALNYLSRSGPDHDGWEPESRFNRRAMAAAEATWERRNRGVRDNMTGMLVYLAGDDDRPREGNLVVRYPYEGPCMYDTETFGEPVGYLRKTRKGRRVVWTVEAAVWTVQFSKLSELTRCFFSAGEAIEYAKTVPTGHQAKVEVSRAARTAHERIAAPDSDDGDVTKIKTVLLSGPWPASMWTKVGLAATADHMVSEGRVVLYRDTEEAGGGLNYKLPGWANMVEAAAKHLHAPGAAVDYTLTDDRVVCTVATVGRFESRDTRGIVSLMREAGHNGRKFILNLDVTLASSNPRIYAKVDGDRLTFTGGKYGDHSLNLTTRTEHEILVHWEGYCDNNGATPVSI